MLSTTLRFIYRRRPTPLRVALILMAVLPSVWLGWNLHQQLHPFYVFPSTQLSTIPFQDFFWVDWVCGDYFKPRNTLITSLPDFTFRPQHSCKTSSFMVVLVSSPPADAERRQLIRDTWGQAVQNDRWPRDRLRGSMEVFFVLGIPCNNAVLKQQLQREAEQHNDLIAGCFVDSYRNLTWKTLTGLNWASQNCSGTQFVMKVDQDTLVDFPRLVSFLVDHALELRNAVIGKLYFKSMRLDNGKWKVSPQEYPMSIYPTFAGGPCYIISTDAVSRMVNASQYLPFLSMEDVHVTGILAKAVGVRRLNMEQLQNWKGPSICTFLERDKYQVSLTNLNLRDLRHAWTVLTTGQCLSPSGDHAINTSVKT